MPFVRVADTEIHFEDDGFSAPWEKPETILIQHGTGRSAQFWTRWVPRLATRYRVIRRDQRGHGESAKPDRDFGWRVTDLADETAEFLDRLGLDRVHYFGESSGGVTGSAFAARHPDRVRSLTLCTVPLDVIPPKNDIFKAGFPDSATAKKTLGGEGWTRAMMDRGVISPGESPEYAAWAIREMGRTEPEVLIGAGSVHYLPNVQVVDLLPLVAAPTLIIAPAKSPVTPLEDQLTMLGLLQNGRIVVVDGPGHEIHVDCREIVIGAFLDFLDKVPR
jgi:pimeloyl-ACP methyl ester carboxylesterase